MFLKYSTFSFRIAELCLKTGNWTRTELAECAFLYPSCLCVWENTVYFLSSVIFPARGSCYKYKSGKASKVCHRLPFHCDGFLIAVSGRLVKLCQFSHESYVFDLAASSVHWTNVDSCPDVPFCVCVFQDTIFAITETKEIWRGTVYQSALSWNRFGVTSHTPRMETCGIAALR